MIIILDFGGQYAHLIASRIRRMKVYTEILPAQTKVAEIMKLNSAGIILSGGPQSVYDKKAPQLDPEILNLKIPVLGICYGHQVIAHTLGGEVKSGKTKEYGPANLKIHNVENPLTQKIPTSLRVWMSHFDEVVKLPKGFITLGSTPDCKNAMVADLKRQIFGVQFHPEVTHTQSGAKILANFIRLTKSPKNWSLKKFLVNEIEAIKKQVGDQKVFLMVSGGVDSTVAFALLERALGKERIFGLFVDTGFSRENEIAEVKKALQKLKFNLHVENAQDKFFQALSGITEPEEKRQIIGKMFLTVQKEVAKKLKLNPKEWFLGQGTIYPDTIETGGTKHADKIKTHHNRVPEIEELLRAGRVVEPLKQLYKDEVRLLGEELGLPRELVWRHPFPGPGLAVRCLCAGNQELISPLTRGARGVNEAQTKINTTLAEFSTSNSKLQSVILPLKSVGVQGDARTYRHPLALFGKIKSWQKLDEITTKMTNHFAEINRVILCLSHANPPALKIIPATLTKKRINLLQKADSAVTKILLKENLYQKVWQFPVVLAPIALDLTLDLKGLLGPLRSGESIILRPVNSTEAMTANFARLPWQVVEKITNALLKISGIEMVFYDLTNKPPGTIEWE